MPRLVIVLLIMTMTGAPAEDSSGPSREQTMEAINAIWKLCGRNDVDGDDILVRYSNVVDSDPYVIFQKVINTRGVANFRTREVRIDLSDTERSATVANHSDGVDYLITFQCKTTACASAGKTEATIRMCGNSPPEKRSANLSRLMNALEHLWDITDRKKLAF